MAELPGADGHQASRPRILFVGRNLPPLRGGMERLNAHIVEELARQFDLAVCGPGGSTAALPFATLVREAPLKPLWKFLTRNFIDALGLARSWRPQLIFCGSGLTVPTALLVSRLCGARVIAYLHGLDIVADQIVYRTIWRRSLRRVDLAIVNSTNTARLAEAAGIERKRIVVLHPGVRMPRIDSSAGTEFRRRFDLDERPLLLSLGRLTARKGLAEFIAKALPELVRAYPRLQLIVIGDKASDALAGGGVDERERILAAARGAGVEQSVRLLGSQPDEVVAEAFQASRALIFPVLDLPGDVEGFGMVAVEAAAHGTPTIAFAVGGVPDAISEGITGRLVNPADYAAMAQAVIRTLDARASDDDAGERQARIDFARGFAWPAFGNRLRAIAREVIAAGRR